MEKIDSWIEKVIINLGVSEGAAPYIRLLVLLLVIALLAWLFFFITKRLVNGVLLNT